MRNRKRIHQGSIDKNLFYVLLFIGFILLLILVNFGKINRLILGPKRMNNKVVVNPKTQEISVLDAIIHAKLLLGVSDENYKNHVGDEAIYISMGVDEAHLDLNYANIIVTGQVEQIGGRLINGIEKNNGNKQILEFEDPHDSQKFFVNLYYSSERDKSERKIQLAVVVDDFGIRNNKLLDDFCSLDKNITFAILPHQKYSKLVMLKANESGHETMIHMPMEPVSYPKDNPGAKAIYVQLSEKEIKNRVENYISELPLCKGANNHMGSFATTDETVMKYVLEVLKKHDLFFVDSRTSQASIAYKVAQEMLIPAYQNQFFLDTPKITEKTLAIKLQKLQNLAKQRDKILVITHCATRDRYIFLEKFIKEINKLDFQLVPVSDLFKTNVPEII
ncbi:MAG: divergent polysaccharide deacetylase family protein [Candidatus Cloacimonetes bacterium]|nr:divergent polysaccharide deacetylase family protein [Candidatus Cloacimonadota bacterium]